MKRLWIPVVATILGLSAVAAYAKDVDLTDQDRVELRQRADALKSENVLGRSRDAGAEKRLVNSGELKPLDAKHTKKRHSKRAHGRRDS